MSILIIAAVAANGVIGRGGRLPWRLPADLAYFKGLTMGHAVLMGRKTWESIGRPLRGRLNIVLSRDPAFSAPGCTVVSNAAQALGAAGTEDVFVIGGESVYAQMLPSADRLYITRVDEEPPGDARFPPIGAGWKLVSERPGVVDADNPHPHRFLVYERAGS
jgi:dihydrofolate reductase